MDHHALALLLQPTRLLAATLLVAGGLRRANPRWCILFREAGVERDAPVLARWALQPQPRSVAGAAIPWWRTQNPSRRFIPIIIP